MITRRSDPPAVWSVLPWAVVLAVLILWSVYPGFMSYDSLHALREARTQVRGGPYPPFVSYVWRPLDMLFPGPAAMLLVQDAVLLLAIAAVFALSGFRATTAVLGLTLVALAPPVLGPMLVVWKDVAMSACFAAAAAVLYFLQARGARASPTWFAVALALVFSGMAYRLNSLPAALPLLVWAAAIRSGGHPGTGRAGAWRVLAAGGVLSALLFAGVTVLNSFRLPEFSRLDPNPSLRALMIYDLIGTTAMAGRAPFAAAAAQDEIALVGEARRIYDPRHLNITLDAQPDGLFRRYAASEPTEKMARAWRQTLRSEPGAYLSHRWAVFRELVGLAAREVFYPTHGGVDSNEFGYVHRPTLGSVALAGYLRVACGASPIRSLACRAWVYQVAGLLAAIVCAVYAARAQRLAAIAIYTSGLAYLLAQFLITPAADLRYTHWSTVASLLVCVIAAAALRDRRARRAVPSRSEAFAAGEGVPPQPGVRQ